VHWLAYLSWPVALWHGLGTGTDTRLPWLLLLDALCVLAVAGAVAWRLTLTRRDRVRAIGLLATAAFVIATIVFVAVGPLQPGWSRRAGTPAAAGAPTATLGRRP
jgi:sulfoxide reductase heme-binding subunit YedZ